jgi:hypothetical protein
MTSQLLIIGIAVGVMLFLLSMIGGILWEHTSTEWYHLNTVRQRMHLTEEEY